MINVGNKEVVGLDIGSSSVKMIQLSKDDSGYSVNAVALADIADGPEQQSKANTISAIRECFEVASVGTHLVVCGLGGPEVMVWGFKFPQIPEDQLERAVWLEAQQVCPLDLKNSTIDYQIITADDKQDSTVPAKKGVNGIMVVATNKAIQEKSQLASEASAKCVLMDVDDLAVLNCFSQCEKPNPGRAITIINVGNSSTTVSILGKNGIPFIRKFGYGSGEIIKKIADDSDSSPEAVSAAFRGLGGVEFDLGEELARACRKLIVGIRETLRYYSAQTDASVINHVSVCGGFALADGFVELLDRSLSVRAELWNPFSKMRCTADVTGEKLLGSMGPALAISAGLAMRSI